MLDLRSSSGIINVGRERIVVDISNDFVDYYHWFVKRKYWVVLQTPLHGAHITIATSKIYKNVNWDRAKDFSKMKIDFDYSVDMIHGGRSKGFDMFYLEVFSDEIDSIKRDIGAIDDEKYRGLHVTIGNFGKNGSYKKLWYPEIIKL